MRRSQNQTYEYSNRVPPNPGYYYDDGDEYVGDYSESDAISDETHVGQPPNVTEIYRRNPMLDRYRQNFYPPSKYCYKNLPQGIAQQMRRPAVPTVYRHHVPLPIVDERVCFYSTGAIDEGYRDQFAYNPQPANSHRPLNSAVAATRTVARRHPVTVPTPKYYRKPTMANIYKKPSTLCLPLASQRDPAVYHRIKKHLEIQAQQQPATQTDDSPAATSPNVQETQTNEENPSIQTCQSEVNTVLARYEEIMGDSCQKTETISSKSSVKTKKSRRRKLLHQMKPKVPASIKEKQEMHLTPQIVNVENLEVEEMTTEVLDSMLSQLINSGCENKIKDNQTEQENLQLSTKNFGPKGDMKCSTSFNYNDISNNITRSQDMYPKLPPLPTNFQEPCNLNIIRQCNQQITSSRISVESAMELHRSKSYIVNLIDRALSKELGTVVEDKSTRIVKDVEQVVPGPVAEGSTKSEKMEKALCFELNQNMTEPVVSNPSPDSRISQTKRSIACSCNKVEEPAYVKQLRQLRWGHIQHIQREVRRLEDLERFLDSCSGDS